jgi:hypothetical protein
MLETASKKTGAALVGELISKKRVAAVDWKEHPLEVMAELDRLAGSVWRKDASRWDFADALDLDRCLPDRFLPACAAALEATGRSVLTFDRDSDEAIFAVVPSKDAGTIVTALERRSVKVARIAPAPTKGAAASKAKTDTRAAEAARKEAAAALAELETRIERSRTTDGAILRHFAIQYLTRLLLAADAPLDEVRRWLDFTVTNELAQLEEMQFQQHGPQVDTELLGAALLVGRGPELVRGFAHVYSLGQRSKTLLYRVFLGRDLPPTWNRGEPKELDALLSADKAKLPAAAEKYLAGTWSSSSRGMKGSRACFLVSGLCAHRGLDLRVSAALDKYVARSLLPAPAAISLTNALRHEPPAPPPFPARYAAVRDGSRPGKTQTELAKKLETWVRESIAQATKEHSGVYLRAVPETAVDVAVLVYAAGAPLDDTKRWLAYAVDLELARCTGLYPEDALAWHEGLREVAGAAVLVGKERALSAAWRGARVGRSGDLHCESVLTSVLLWLEGKPATPSANAPKKRVQKAMVGVLATRDANAVASFFKTPGAVPFENPALPWPGPFSAFVTALAKPLDDLSLFESAVMRELLGRGAAELPSFVWKAPRTKLPLDDLRGVAASAARRIGIGAEAVRCASDCLLVARCVHALGAPISEVASWLHRSVDLAKRDKHMDEDLVGAARLVGRGRELAKTIGAFDTRAPETAFAKALLDYATDVRIEKVSPALKQRFFFSPFVEAALAAQGHDLVRFRKALGRAPWQHHREWTGADNRPRPPYWSFFVLALAADMGGVEALPKSALPFVDAEIVRAAVAGELRA